jgi:plastocyanin
MRKSLVICIALFCFLTACGFAKATTNNPHAVEMLLSSFDKTSITIPKGSTIAFVDDSNTGGLHILVIGQNGLPQSENGAPDFGGSSGKRINPGDVWTSPPWTKPGVYHVACKIHPAMNLTVTVLDATATPAK